MITNSRTVLFLVFFIPEKHFAILPIHRQVHINIHHGSNFVMKSPLCYQPRLFFIILSLHNPVKHHCPTFNLDRKDCILYTMYIAIADVCCGCGHCPYLWHQCSILGHWDPCLLQRSDGFFISPFPLGEPRSRCELKYCKKSFPSDKRNTGFHYLRGII